MNIVGTVFLNPHVPKSRMSPHMNALKCTLSFSLADCNFKQKENLCRVKKYCTIAKPPASARACCKAL